MKNLANLNQTTTFKGTSFLSFFFLSLLLFFGSCQKDTMEDLSVAKPNTEKIFNSSEFNELNDLLELDTIPPYDYERNVTFHNKHSDIAKKAMASLLKSNQAVSRNGNRDDGQAIVFHTNKQIYVKDVDGSNLKKLLDLEDYTLWKFISDVEWSLDGKKIAFAAVRKDIRIVDLFVMDANGSNFVHVQSLMGNQFASIDNISWRPDNQYIFFVYGILSNYDYHGAATWSSIDGESSGFTTTAYTSSFKRAPFNQVNEVLHVGYSSLSIADELGENAKKIYTPKDDYTNFIGRSITEVEWNDESTFYCVVREAGMFEDVTNPGNQTLFRINKNGNAVPVLYGNDSVISALTVSPDGHSLYMSTHKKGGSSELNLIQLNADGSFKSATAIGYGFNPDWR